MLRRVHQRSTPNVSHKLFMSTPFWPSPALLHSSSPFQARRLCIRDVRTLVSPDGRGLPTSWYGRCEEDGKNPHWMVGYDGNGNRQITSVRTARISRWKPTGGSVVTRLDPAKPWQQSLPLDRNGGVAMQLIERKASSGMNGPPTQNGSHW